MKWQDLEIRNPKSYIRNNIEIQMFKIRNTPKLSCSWQRPLGLEHWDFGHWKFVSDFDIRISDFLIAFMPRRFARSGPVQAGKAKLR